MSSHAITSPGPPADRAARTRRLRSGASTGGRPRTLVRDLLAPGRTSLARAEPVVDCPPVSASILLPLCLAVASALGPPALPEGQPPAPAERAPPPNSSQDDALQDGASPDTAELAPPQTPPRGSLPAGLEPVANPFESPSPPDPAPADAPEVQPEGSSEATPPPAPVQAPPPRRRSIVDLRDPFERPPPRVRTSRAAGQRMILPDLKDPFAPGVRRVRSRTLSQGGLRDIRDPFREGARLGGPRPPCARTTDDGTVVQAPGAEPQPRPNCSPAALDLRDPFDDR